MLKLFFLLSLLFNVVLVLAQKIPVLQTGGKKMPNEWIDSATGHKVIKLTRREGNNYSFYFHNNPFVKNKMVFYGTNEANTKSNDSVKQEISNITIGNKQIYTIDLSNLEINQITYQKNGMNGEIVAPKNKLVYYQIKDSVFSTHIESKKTTLVYVFPADFKASITAINSNETLLGGAWATEAEKEIYKKNPNKASYFDLIYDAHLPKTLFTINVNTGELKKVFTDSAWLNHVQFSTTDPNLLMFCHEGPWHKVDRMWTIDLATKKTTIMHHRTMPMEIAGHEFPSVDGKHIWFDLQQPRSTTFYLAKVDVKTLEEQKYSLTRDEWSIHYNISPDQKLFCGDGGDAKQVAKAKDGMWIYLFKPEGDKLVSTKLVEMKNHNYKTEPNVHFSPDGKWIIFRANFEGNTNIYAVEIAKHKFKNN